MYAIDNKCACDLIDAWIVTGGTHVGVMKHVGEAVRHSTIARGNNKPITTIAVAPWGCISNRSRLTDSQVRISDRLPRFINTPLGMGDNPR